MSLYSLYSSSRCFFLSISFYCFRKYETFFFVLPKVVVSSSSFETSLRETSLFVSLILRSRSVKYCRNPLRYRDRPKYNSHFLRSSSLSPRLISSFNVLTNINCLLNCYLIEKIMNSLHYFLLLLFEFPNLDKCSFFVLSLNLLISFPLTYSRSFLMIFSF